MKNPKITLQITGDVMSMSGENLNADGLETMSAYIISQIAILAAKNGVSDEPKEIVTIAMKKIIDKAFYFLDNETKILAPHNIH